MTKHIKVNSISTAWEVAASIFPTDYQKDEESSKRAGYPIYKTTSTDESFSGFHISDLNTRLEVSIDCVRYCSGCHACDGISCGDFIRGSSCGRYSVRIYGLKNITG